MDANIQTYAMYCLLRVYCAPFYRLPPQKPLSRLYYNFLCFRAPHVLSAPCVLFSILSVASSRTILMTALQLPVIRDAEQARGGGVGYAMEGSAARPRGGVLHAGAAYFRCFPHRFRGAMTMFFTKEDSNSVTLCCFRVWTQEFMLTYRQYLSSLHQHLSPLNHLTYMLCDGMVSREWVRKLCLLNFALLLNFSQSMDAYIAAFHDKYGHMYSRYDPMAGAHVGKVCPPLPTLVLAYAAHSPCVIVSRNMHLHCTGV